jgi:hypothetical protein
MSLPYLGSIKLRDFLHAALGGGISFSIVFFLTDFAERGLTQLLLYLGITGVMIFEPFGFAREIFIFGLVYIVAGFFAGLYTGYQIEENLKVILFFPGLIGFVLFLTVSIITNMYISFNTIIFSLLGNIIGSFLGGYTLNWSREEDHSEMDIDVEE